MRQIVIPIFYGVEPYEPRHQEGVFKEAFSGHEESFEENVEKVQMWRKSLKEVSDLSGFHLKDGYEAEFIEGVVKEISSKLTSSTSVSTSTSASNLINLKRLVTASATAVITCLENLVMQQAHTHTIRVVGPITQYLTPFFLFLNFFWS
ncbi:TMV resistance protein N-like [Mangifera indica]|uniref:TMV resistance protein N-like n=1 Tax=Mangifera indica TaxID=29780 RepID=UPI001CF9DFDA|nr:TMV resistance protein N-like [Mangifera indica]